MTIDLGWNVSSSLSAGITKVADPNANVVGIMTNEESSFPYENGTFFTSTEVGEYWGIDSVTYAMANTILGQSPGVLSGGGYVTIVKMQNTTDGKPASFVTSDLSGKIDDFKAVTNGSLSLSINGNVRESIFMDFTNINTLTDIAKVINDKAFGYVVTADEETGVITLSTKVVGSTVIFVSATPTQGTSLAAAGFLDLDNATDITGIDATGETIGDVLTRLDGSVHMHGVMTTKVCSSAEKIATAEYMNGKEYLYYPEISGMQEAKEVGEAIVEKSLWNTRLQTNLSDELLEAKKLVAGSCSKMFSANPNMSNVALTMEGKIITGVSGTDKIGTTELTTLLERGVDVYCQRTATLSNMITSNANKYTDVAYLSNLIQMLLRVNVYNVFLTDTKVPQTSVGRAKIKKAVADTLDKLVRAGWLATGEAWNGDKFGNETEFEQSILLNGYYIYIIPEVTQADREKRTALLQIACKASGAYHGANLRITLEE